MVPAFNEAADEYNEDDDNESTTVDDADTGDEDTDDDADTDDADTDDEDTDDEDDDATVDKLGKGGMYEKEAPKCVRRRRDRHSSIHSRDTF